MDTGEGSIRRRRELVNDRRRVRVQVKRDLAHGTLDPVVLIFDVRPELDDVAVMELLGWVRDLPPRFVFAGLEEMGIPPTQTMAQLDTAMRSDLARWLRRQVLAGG